jgi:hypothetical protein
MALHVRDNSWADLPKFHNLALAFAAGAFGRGSVDDLSFSSQLHRFATVQIFQTDFEGMIDYGFYDYTRAHSPRTNNCIVR